MLEETTGLTISSNSELSTISSKGTSAMVEFSSALLPDTTDSSLASFDCFDWLPGDAGGVIDLRLRVNGRLKMSTSDCPFRLPSEALPAVINAGYDVINFMHHSIQFMLKINTKNKNNQLPLIRRD